MSSDLINRRALCDDLREYKVHHIPVSSDESEVKGYNDGIDLAISVIAEFPSAESERKGEWLEKEVFDNVDYEIPEWQSEKCSVCGKYHTTPYLYNFSTFAYCPNCGSKMMRGEE